MSTRIAIPNRAKAERAVREWNDKHNPGKLVAVTLDDRSLKETFTTSEAWVLGGHTAVVKINGISGAYALSRVRPRQDDTVPYDPAGM